MKTEIRDAEAVQAIRPVDAALYLRAAGWTQRDIHAGRAAAWSKVANDGEFEALLPLNHELSDYALRMGELLQVLSAVEGRSQT